MREKPNIRDVAQVVPEATDLEEVGSGGYKVVYRAKLNGETEAVKLVQIPFDPNDSTVQDENTRRINREINILRTCKSPYLVKLGSIAPRQVTIGSYGYVLYSEEYVPGDSLRNLIGKGYRPAVQELAETGLCLLNAIHELAERSVIHRDIKPDNIIKTGKSDRPYMLLDLGIAFHIGGTPITQSTDRVPGTLYYIAPEMLEPGFRQNLDHRADLYTIALTLYEFASGDNPFAHRGDPQFTTLYRIKTETPKPLFEHRPDLPVEFCRVVDQLMKKLPALRPSNILMLINRMEAFR